MPNNKRATDSILRQLIALSWPIVLAFMMQTSYNLIDLFWVGKLGATAIAAVSLAGNIFYVILAVGQILGSGTVALVAHAFGAGLAERANQIVEQSLSMTSIIAFTVCLAGLLFTKQIIMFLGGSGDVLFHGTDYLRIVFIGFFFQLLSFSINYAFRGTGDMKTPMTIMLVATVVNLVLDPLLILGIGFFPRLEVRGAAIATAIAQFSSFLIGLVILIRGRSGIKLKPKRQWHFEPNIIKRIFSIGIPAGISYGLMATSVMIIFGVVAAFSEYALAALGIGTRIFQFASLPVVGIGVATTTLVGQNLGARAAHQATRVGNTAILMSTVIMILCTVVFTTCAHPLIAFFTDSPPVITQGVNFLHIVAYYLLFVGITTSLAGVFRGAGYTLPPMFVGFLKVMLLYALAIILTRTLHLGVVGVWWAMLVSYGIESIMLFIWYRQGGWREKGLELLKGLAVTERSSIG